MSLFTPELNKRLIESGAHARSLGAKALEPLLRHTSAQEIDQELAGIIQATQAAETEQRRRRYERKLAKVATHLLDNQEFPSEVHFAQHILTAVQLTDNPQLVRHAYDTMQDLDATGSFEHQFKVIEYAAAHDLSYTAGEQALIEHERAIINARREARAAATPVDDDYAWLYRRDVPKPDGLNAYQTHRPADFDIDTWLYKKVS